MTQQIYCPACQWRPGPLDLWSCVPRCSTAWNTFATGGVCPGCGVRWHRTQCLACGVVSAHRDWYHDSDSDPSVTTPRERVTHD